MERYLPTLPADAYLDIDGIELVHVEDPLPHPEITGFSPKKGRPFTEVTIQGSGFAVPSIRNRVFVGTSEIPLVFILESSSTRLKIEVPPGDGGRILVKTPGSLEATSEEVFLMIGRPARFEVSGGNAQVGSCGESLLLFVASVADRHGTGIPAAAVSFHIVSGEGSLSTTEAATDDDGLARTTLTLGSTPGIVRVEARKVGFPPLVFEATAVRP
jgi:hypothetical protein